MATFEAFLDWFGRYVLPWCLVIGALGMLAWLVLTPVNFLLGLRRGGGRRVARGPYLEWDGERTEYAEERQAEAEKAADIH